MRYQTNHNALPVGSLGGLIGNWLDNNPWLRDGGMIKGEYKDKLTANLDKTDENINSTMSRKLLNGDRNFENIASLLDNWVDNHPWAHGGWVPGNVDWDEFIANLDQSDAGANPIQQVREEIMELVKVLLETVSGRTAVEIGMGRCGGSHYLWSLMFDRVVTVDVDEKLIERFIYEHMPPSNQSTFIFGKSFENNIADEVGRTIRHCDFMLIDGDHTRDAVETDWRMYNHLVEPGGIIAFHDTIKIVPGELEVAGFVQDLESGAVTGNPVPMRHIHKSKFVGISYYTVS